MEGGRCGGSGGAADAKVRVVGEEVGPRTTLVE
jgi:hypothetical protein